MCDQETASILIFDVVLERKKTRNRIRENPFLVSISYSVQTFESSSEVLKLSLKSLFYI